MNIRWSIFPKFQKHLDVQALAALVREAGLDTTNLVIRDGYWVSRADLAAELPAFLRAMRGEGLEVRFATAGFSAEEMLADPAPLSLLADNGITEFRMGYFKGDGPDVRGALRNARHKLEQIVALCERRNIRCVYQVHHGTLVPGASAAYHLVEGLPARWIGVELDPGNQTFEGFENWGRSARLLGEYLVALGVKDSAVVRDPARAEEPGKGWSRHWCPLYEGVVNWYDVARALRSVDFAGTFVFMPFYDENDPAEQARKLKREVAYLRRVVAAVEAEEK
jgi:sugar phosphate isomerase/epimerase